ncbi:MAG TPA: asparagine synthase (glutamine-hydrolyzing) [Nitrospira sp.]|nr:asparagine synthase (glutamine-hydrolyzing) [Nitrospira sp.]
MCGIVGAVHVESGRIDQSLVRNMCALIRRRGPDDEGFHFDGYAGLGMRRLAIIDVNSGRQPIYNEDRTVAVVFNGEIYNYRELREELLKRGHCLTTHSDTECIAHLYEDFGEDFVAHLRGMFAIAIWDVRQRKLVLARDRFGIKPLYYWQDGSDLYFGSELKCLLSVDRYERRMDIQSVSDFFTFKYVPGPRTIYEDITELPPGHVAVWRQGNLALRRYWQLKFVPDHSKPADYYREGLLHHLEEAVRLHLVSEVPLGSFLSGGIDSSAVVALMSKICPGNVKTFTVGFGEGQPGADERPYARTIAKMFQTDHSECLYDNPQKQVESILPSMIEAFDEPFADSSMIPNYLICQAARQWVTVALSGIGGDELFAGYERYRGTLAADSFQRVPKFLSSAMKASIRALPHLDRGGVWIDRMQRFVEGAGLPLPERYQRYLSAFTEAEKDSFFSRDFVEQLRKKGGSTELAMRKVEPCSDPLEWLLLTDMETYLPDDELRKADRLSMWHSLEVRVPYLDHKLVEFIATIPSQLKLKGWEKKHILIQSLKKILPDSILNRRKQGFSIPLGAWLRGPLKVLMYDSLSSSRLFELTLFEKRAVERILDEHIRGVRNHETQIWSLLMFVLWHQRYISHPT